MASTSTATDLHIVHVPIDELHPDPKNPRKISDAELDALTRSMREFGFLQPVIARHDDHVVVGGHQRLVAARRLGHKTVPVTFVDLSPEQSHLLNLALNKISGDWDEQLLARMLTDLQANAVDLTVSGFGADEINALLKSLEASDKRDRLESCVSSRSLILKDRDPLRPSGVVVEFLGEQAKRRSHVKRAEYNGHPNFFGLSVLPNLSNSGDQNVVPVLYEHALEIIELTLQQDLFAGG